MNSHGGARYSVKRLRWKLTDYISSKYETTKAISPEFSIDTGELWIEDFLDYLESNDRENN